MAYRDDLNKTMFGDLRQQAAEVFRVQTAASIYYVAFHRDGARRYVIVRGASGTDRENVVIRDSDPRIGEHSMFELPHADWVGRVMEVATMRTSPITSVSREGSGGAAGPQPRVRINPPGDLPEHPKMAPVRGIGTQPGMPAPSPQREAARQVVIGDQEPAVPYPERHVRHAENCAAQLRSIFRRDRLFDDLDRGQRARLDRALDDCEQLLGEIRARAR